MKNADESQFKQAFELMHSDKSELLVENLRKTVREALDKAHGVREATVESVVRLDGGEKQQLESFLECVFKEKLTTTYKTNSTLLGGLKIQVGDWKLDGSLVDQLDHMQDMLRISL